LINGEPTDSRLATATRGILRVRLTAAGRAAHSSVPEQGESAIEKLLDVLLALRGLPLPVDSELGATFYTVGLIEGGVAPNVIPAHASAEVMFRTIGSADDILAVLRRLEPRVAISGSSRSAHPYAHRLRLRDACLPVHDGRAAARLLGTPLLFDPVRSRGAHRRGVRDARRAARRRRIRAPCQGCLAAPFPA
jgi:acetylornithine deacetylase